MQSCRRRPPDRPLTRTAPCWTARVLSGCILAELILGKTLLKGAGEMDQVGGGRSLLIPSLCM